MIINSKTIIKDTDPLLRNKSREVSLPLNEEDNKVLEGLYQYVKESRDPHLCAEKDLKPAVGIAAIQTGISKRLLAVIVDEEDDNGKTASYHYALANAKIISQSAQQAYLPNGEGCLSVEGEHQGLVHRSYRVKVKAFDLLQNKEITIRAVGYLAIVLQHEIDHFSGVLFYDHINALDPYTPQKDAIEID